jgi:hypothetical protein
MLLVAGAICLAMATGCLADSIQKIGDNAKIDWTNHYYIVQGQGAMPSAKEQPNRARAKLMAKDYAKMDALANLLMAVEGTAISYESTGKDYMANTTIRQKIEGFVKNAQVTKYWDEKIEGDTLIVVEVRAPMFTANGPGTVFIKEEAKEKPETVVETSVKVVLKPDKGAAVTTTTIITPVEPTKEFTGLIVDCSGYKIDRCMSPKVRKTDGTEVWGTVRVNFDTLQDKGIVAYATSMAEAKKNARAGSNPLIIRASGRAGGRFYSDAVITENDAQVLIGENDRSHFLDNFNVIFIKDPVL